MTPPPVDAVLIVSFGGPNKRDDVMPFLRNVTAGRNVPEERLLGVAEHYFAVDGKSPINEQNRALIDALRVEFTEHGIDLPVYFGNRNWDPFLVDAIREIKNNGHRRVAAFVTSAFSSFSGCRQYRQDIAKTFKEIDAPPTVEKVRQFFNHPGFIEPMIDNVLDALRKLDINDAVQVAFTAHSIPTSMANNSRYEAQLEEACRLVMSGVSATLPWKLVYQSRSGPPSIPWLDPDINDHLKELSTRGTKGVVVVPIGFVSDHMEVVHDLDTEATETAAELGLAYQRARTAGTDPRFVSMIRELIVEIDKPNSPRRALGSMGVVGCLGGNCCLAS